MSAYDHQENQNLSEEEYLRTEELSEVRREYINGQLFPKNGESFNHNFIVGNIGCNFSVHLKDSPCNTYMLAMLHLRPLSWLRCCQKRPEKLIVR